MSSKATSGQSHILASVPNLRDLGGMDTADGRRVRKGVVYRSEQLSRVADADMPAYEALQLKKIYDLRTAGERAAEIDRVPDGATLVVVDVLADDQHSGAAELFDLFADATKANEELGDGKAAQLLERSYTSLVILPSALAGYSQMYSEMAHAGNLPAVFHCTTGKDRTGWAAAALLALCGVPEKEILRNYMESNDHILPEYQPMIDKFVDAGLQKEILTSILGVRQEYIETAVRVMEDRYGTIQNYFSTGLGIDAEMQQTLRETLLEPVSNT